ncbi:MAG TPA: BMP family ABC transporter substrate-binding protein [Treponema sp.]|nr:BMP family ABC transporter substrate-binding protein [Treponema sp.]HBB42268.1 BMP family ABC transporter substrate-binding protein [Treponema sp.]
MKKSFLIAAALTAVIPLTACNSKNKSKAPSIAVFVPGIMADSPTYAHFAAGVQAGVDEYNSKLQDKSLSASVYIMEAGTNQAEWQSKLTALAADGSYDVIFSSNPSIPELADPLTKQFPNQKFILMDGALDGNNNIACVSYNQKEQTYLSGYISGLMSKTHKVGLIAAQEYPVMNNVLYPYYAKGAADAYEGTTCDFRIVGNWYDAAKGAEIADALYSQGVDVILPICGGASQGVISSAVEHGFYLSYIDENSFVKAPGTVISSCATKQELASKECVLAFLNGSTEWGKTKVVGLQQGYIEFIQDDPLYNSTVPENIRKTMAELVSDLMTGKRNVPEI